MPLILRSAFLGLSYYTAAIVSLQLAVIENNVSPLWPPTGIAVAGFMIFGRKSWPAVLVAAFLVNLPITSPTYAAVTAAGNTAAPLLAATVLQRLDFHTALDRLRDAVTLVAVALTTMTVSSLVGVAALLASDRIDPGQGLEAWSAWWAGDAMGVLVVAPFLLGFARWRAWRSLGPGRWIEALAVLGAVAIAAGLPDARFLVFPVIAYAAWRFRLLLAAPAAFLAASVASATAVTRLTEDASLVQQMIRLQAFNAAVALLSFVFAVALEERDAAQRKLLESHAHLETEVSRRTAVLTKLLDRVRSESADRQKAEELANQRAALLAEAQALAHVGSWEWHIAEEDISWSDELFRIHGFEPQAFKVTFERAIDQVVEADRRRITSNVEAAFARKRDHELPALEYSIALPNGEVRHLLGQARLQFDGDGRPFRMSGTVQDITESRRARLEHELVAELQRSLMPEQLPPLDGLEVAARYAPAVQDVLVGGDWFDVIEIDAGEIGLVVGDVAGRGIPAAAMMSQLRSALRAYAATGTASAKIVEQLRLLMLRDFHSEMVTMAMALLDTRTGTVRLTNAGHPPPLLIGPKGQTEYITERVGPPLCGGLGLGDDIETVVSLTPGSILCLYTDGLIEDREAGIDKGLERLQKSASQPFATIDELCDRLLADLTNGRNVDDIALLLARWHPQKEKGVVRI